MKDFRSELKHYINYVDLVEIQSRIKHITNPDPHTGENGSYIVRSLYFDNYEDKALREKINGLNSREKFRIRYYENDPDFIRLEKKSKINGLCKKVSAPISKEECKRLLEHDYRWLKYNKNPLLLELYSKMHFQMLRPRTIVEYDRAAYLYAPGNVRITFDTSIRGSSNVTDFLSGELVLSPVFGQIVLEVKFDNFCPQIIKDLTQVAGRQASSCSKYALARA